LHASAFSELLMTWNCHKMGPIRESVLFLFCYHIELKSVQTTPPRKWSLKGSPEEIDAYITIYLVPVSKKMLKNESIWTHEVVSESIFLLLLTKRKAITYCLCPESSFIIKLRLFWLEGIRDKIPWIFFHNWLSRRFSVFTTSTFGPDLIPHR
jgi:hypothetical protein